MTQHTELIERLHASSRWWFDRGVRNSADADAIYALEAQAREISELKAQLAATAKNAFEAMPHDIPRRMKDAICEETGWSGSMVSRMYTELRKAFTGEPYRANEDLDSALLEIELLRKDAALVAARERERIAAWIEPQRNDVPATGYEFALAIRALNTEGEGNDATTAQKGGE